MKTLKSFKLLVLAQVALMAVLFNGCDDISITTIKNRVSFGFEPTSSIKVGDTIIFSNTSTGCANCLWDFGDGTESTLTHPTHVYEKKGLYNVTLKAYIKSADRIIDSLVLSKPLNVSIQPSESNFTHKRIAVLTIAFTNTSTNSTQCTWSFGDGSTSTETSPTHTYHTFGDKTVTLTTFNDGCHDSIVKVIELPALIDLKETHLDGAEYGSYRYIDIDFDGTTDLEIAANYQINVGAAISSFREYYVIFIKCQNDYEVFTDTTIHLGRINGVACMDTLTIAKINLPGDTLRINNAAKGWSSYLTMYSRDYLSYHITDKWINSNEIRYVGFRKRTNGINKLGWIKVKVTSLKDIILYSIRMPSEGEYLVIE